MTRAGPRSLASAWALLACCLWAPAVNATERILDYRSEIVVAVDASMDVTEQIRVRAEGREIRRGIYRDFPTDYRDRFGNRYRVGFQVESVTRDGDPEPWHTEELAAFVQSLVQVSNTDPMRHGGRCFRSGSPAFRRRPPRAAACEGLLH